MNFPVRFIYLFAITVMLKLVLFPIQALSATETTDCQDTSFDAVMKHGKIKEMQKSCLQKTDTTAISEKIYIQAALENRHENLKCLITTFEHVTGPNALSFSRDVLTDIDKKSAIIRQLKKELVRLTAARGRLAMPLQKDEILKNDQHVDATHQAIELTYQSMFMGSTTEIRNFADSLEGRDNQSIGQKLSLLESSLKKITVNLKEQKSSVAQLLGSNSAPSTELYKSLIRDPSILTEMSTGKNPEEIKFLQSAHCHLDKKFGIQKEQADQRRDLALNATAVLIPISTSFTLLKLAGSKVLKVSGAVKTSKILAFGASGALGLVAANDEMERSCGVVSRDIDLGSSKVCATSKGIKDADLINNLQKQNCFYAGFMQSLLLAPGLALELRGINQQRNLDRLANPRDVSEYYSDYSKTDLKIHAKEVNSRLQTLLDADDAHAQYLKSIGVVPGAAPQPRQIFVAIDQQLQKQINSKSLKESEVLRPARIFEMKSGNLEALEPGAVVPEGAKPYEKLLSDREYWKLLGEGKFPIGESDGRTLFERVNLGPAFFHDLSHFSGFSRNTDYMKGLREVAPVLAKMSDAELKNAQPALFFVSETMSAFPKNSESQIKKFIGSVRPVASDEPLGSSAYKSLLSEKSDTALKVLWERSQELLPKMESYGGLSSDQISRQSPAITARFAPLESAYTGGAGSGALTKFYDRDKMLTALANRLTIADHLKSSSAGEMVKDLVFFRSGSPVMKLFCTSKNLIPELSTASKCSGSAK